MIDLYNAATNQLIGSITEADLKVLIEGGTANSAGSK